MAVLVLAAVVAAEPKNPILIPAYIGPGAPYTVVVVKPMPTGGKKTIRRKTPSAIPKVITGPNQSFVSRKFKIFVNK